MKHNQQTMVVVAYFDLETTGFFTTSEIVQIACITDKGKTFNQFVFPDGHIPLNAQKIHGIYKSDEDLMRDGEVLRDAAPPYEALKTFSKFLSKACEENGEKIWLCAHNCMSFDSKVLHTNLERYDVFLPKNVEYCDSLTILKKFKQDKGKYSNDI